MSSPLVPLALFASMVLTMTAAVPLAGPAPTAAVVCVALSALAFAALAGWVLRADAASDPRRGLTRTLERFDERWPRFERDFWAHVDARDAAPELD